MHTFAVFIQRLGPIDSGNNDNKGNGKNGILSFGVGPIKTVSQVEKSGGKTGIEIRVTDESSPREEPGTLTEQPKETKPFRDINTALQHFWDHPEDIQHQHEMAVPRDEWRINLDGYVDVYAAVERVYLDDDNDSDSDGEEYTTERDPGCFVDVIDLVIRVKGDPGYRDLEGNEDPGLEEDGDLDGRDEDKSDDGRDHDDKEKAGRRSLTPS
ncbi:hypothetical protein ONZ43_g6531 [Nemania bipapillata]|uniref:Uncharacterized protein n=1 Tax=Nemania bipapillata TaxID=110536 RepID=A0ACC2HYB6_9PEZI|nr:hypothetical protein ONZ43_g6531 [Nemania bipapillata]